MAPDNFKGEFVGISDSFCSKCNENTRHRAEKGTQTKGASDKIINIKKYSCENCGDFKYELLDKVDDAELISQRNKTQYHKKIFGYFMLLGYFGVVVITSVLNFFEYKIISPIINLFKKSEYDL